MKVTAGHFFIRSIYTAPPTKMTIFPPHRPPSPLGLEKPQAVCYNHQHPFYVTEGSDNHGRTDPHDAAIPGDQVGIPGRDPLLPHGGLLRDVPGRRPDRLPHFGYRPYLPQQGERRRDPLLRRPLPLRLPLYRQADRIGPQGGHLRAGGRPQTGQGDCAARGGQGGHAGASHRNREPVAGRKQLSARPLRRRQ